MNEIKLILWSKKSRFMPFPNPNFFQCTAKWKQIMKRFKQNIFVPSKDLFLHRNSCFQNVFMMSRDNQLMIVTVILAFTRNWLRNRPWFNAFHRLQQFLWWWTLWCLFCWVFFQFIRMKRKKETLKLHGHVLGNLIPDMTLNRFISTNKSRSFGITSCFMAKWWKLFYLWSGWFFLRINWLLAQCFRSWEWGRVCALSITLLHGLKCWEQPEPIIKLSRPLGTYGIITPTTMNCFISWVHAAPNLRLMSTVNPFTSLRLRTRG